MTKLEIKERFTRYLNANLADPNDRKAHLHDGKLKVANFIAEGVHRGLTRWETIEICKDVVKRYGLDILADKSGALEEDIKDKFRNGKFSHEVGVDLVCKKLIDLGYPIERFDSEGHDIRIANKVLVHVKATGDGEQNKIHKLPDGRQIIHWFLGNNIRNVKRGALIIGVAHFKGVAEPVYYLLEGGDVADRMQMGLEHKESVGQNTDMIHFSVVEDERENWGLIDNKMNNHE